MTTTPTLWKSLGKVNTGDVGPTGDFQFDPVVTGLANGNFLIAYTDDSNAVDSSSGNDILGRLYDPEGNALGNSFRLNSIAAVDSETDPEVAGLSDGGFVLVYEDFDGATNRLLWQTHNAAGNLVDQGELQADPGAEDVADPKVAVFSDDSFVVVYTRTVNATANTEIRARIVDATGTEGPEFTIRAHPDDPRQPSVTVLENDNFVVTYVEDDGANAKIEYIIYDSSGTLVRALTNIVSPGSENEDPQVVALEGGGFAISWSDETDFMDENIYARVYNSSGNDLSGLINVATDADDDAEPALAALDDGGFVVLYDDDGTEAIRGQRFASLGTAVGGVFTLEASNQLVNTPEVAQLADGRFVGTWQIFDTIGNDFDVSAEIWDPRDTVIRGSQGGDVITGRQGTSTIFGLSGEDKIFGVVGNDKIYGGTSADTVYGGSGNDTIVDNDQLSGDTHDGGSGQDWIDFSPDAFGPFVRIDLQAGLATFTGGNTDLILNFEHAIAGRDAQLLGTSGTNTLVGLSNGDNYINGRGGNDTLFGAGGANTLYGNDGSDRIYGGFGIDRGFGGSGIDTISGGNSNDTLYGGSNADRLSGDSANDTLYGGCGLDRLFGGFGDDHAAGGDDRDTVDGGSGADTLNGDSGDDFILGGSGTDTLDGGADDDTLSGGQGYDRMFGDLGDDLLLDDGSGAALFGGDGNDTAVGSSARDVVNGGSGDDTVTAGSGDDTILGRSGADLIYGGEGSDTLIIASGNQVLGDLYNGGKGDDWVLFTSGIDALDLGAFVSIQRGSFFGTSDDDSIQGSDFASGDDMSGFSGKDDIRGGERRDTLFGGSGNDALRGDSGVDTAFGDDGNDVLFGGQGNDILAGGSGNDRMVGGTGIDLLFGGSGSDRLNGGSGSDTAVGGRINDTFIVDTAGDVVVETASGGIEDVVRVDATTYTLGGGAEGFVERLNLNGTAGDARLVGNEHANTLIGNTSDNALLGRSGADILNANKGGSNLLIGGSGDDTFVVATVADEVRDFAGGGRDLVRAETDYTLPDGTATAFIEDLRLQGGKGDIDATGNSLDNIIQGNSGNNRLAGNQGDDTLEGGEGDDLMFGGAGADRFDGESGADTLNIGKDDAAFGGSGGDSFRFSSTNLASGTQVLRDFDGVSLNAGNGEDKLVFATGLESGSFDYIGAAAFSGGGDSEARFAGPLTLEIDQDGDGGTDIAVRVNGLTAANLLTASDFVWL